MVTNSAFDPSKFTTTEEKPMLVYLLLDVSGTMSGRKIDSLNAAVREMLDSFSKQEVLIMVSVITFGGSVSMHLPPTKASKITWHDLSAGGMTPMGAAINMAKGMIEDKNITPSRAYRPTVVLMSDGEPNDSWESPLEKFVKEGRSAKCDRMSVAIGADVGNGELVLKKFMEGTDHELFYAETAKRIHEFFKFLTMSTLSRSRSANPNQVPKDSEIKLDGNSISSKISKPNTNSTSAKPADNDDDPFF